MCLAGATAASITMPLDFAKTVLQCGSELPIHKVLKQTLHDKGPSGLFTGMVSFSSICSLQTMSLILKFGHSATALSCDNSHQIRVPASISSTCDGG